MSPADAIGPDELVALARTGAAEAASPLAGQPWLLLRLGQAGAAPSPDEEALVTRWLRRQACPVIAIAETGASDPLRAACDVVLGDLSGLDGLLDNIRRSPIAAMVLVQVLRATEQLPVEQGLVVESLAYATLQGGPEFRRWLGTRAPRTSIRGGDPGPAVLLARSGDEVEIRLNRPSRRNALSVEMRDGLCEALRFVAADPSIRRARVSGSGPCFSAGGDLDEFGTAPDTATAHAVRSLRLPAAALQACIERVEFRVHGACIGAGAELPAFGRHVRAARDAFFQLPEIRFGLIPGAGGCISIPRRIGRQRTAFLGLSGERIDAWTALSWGLVDAIDD